MVLANISEMGKNKTHFQLNIAQWVQISGHVPLVLSI